MLYEFVHHQCWRLQCRLNRRLPFCPQGSDTADFVVVPQSREPLGRASGTPPLALGIAVCTYARVSSCGRLLDALCDSVEEAGLADSTFFVVVQDQSEHDYRPVLDLLKKRLPGRFAFYGASEKLGKPGRFVGCGTAFRAIRAANVERMLFLEDDIEIAPGFVRKSLAAFDSIEDEEKAALYLCKFDDDEVMGRWTRFRRRESVFPGIDRTQWLDLHAFLAGRRFFDVFESGLFQPFPGRWQANPERSSGVAEQITLRMRGRGSIYQVRESLAFHGASPSLLNVAARQKRPLRNLPLPSVAD